MQFLSYTFLFQ